MTLQSSFDTTDAARQHAARDDAEFADVVALLAALVRVPTVNPPGDELEAARVLHEWLLARGIDSTLDVFDGTRANVVARVKGTGSQPALVLCGHLDVVPAGDAVWQHAPFAAEIVEGRMVGRGTSDMKASVAAMAGTLVRLQRRADELAGDVLLFAVADEETNSTGALRLMEQGAFAGVGGLVIGEPTSMRPAIAHKGVLRVRFTIPGKAAHSSMPALGSNAIVHAAALIQALQGYRFAVERHALLGEPTLSINMINGGSAINIVPDRCELSIDMRSVPGVDHEAVLADLRQLLDASLSPEIAAGSVMTVILDRPAVSTDAGEAVIRAAQMAVKATSSASPDLVVMTYCTDASVIVPPTGLPTVIIGPGDAEQAHQTDEWVSLNRVREAVAAYEQLALNYLRPSN